MCRTAGPHRPSVRGRYSGPSVGIDEGVELQLRVC